MPAGPTGRPRFLASVTSAEEALTAAAAGAEIIDCKNPAAGALGALALPTVRAIVAAVGRAVPVSATVGDLVPVPDRVCKAAAAMASTGVDLVKIGFFSGGDAAASIRSLGGLDLGGARLVGLLLADCEPELDLVDAMAAAGFAGIMLDTATKDGRALPDVMPASDIGAFIVRARDAGLFVGLAGSLKVAHIGPLAGLAPDVLGFRGALCSGLRRQGPLDENAARGIAAELGRLGRRPAARHAILEAAP